MIEKSYSPEKIEPKWSDDWISSGIFHADENSSKEPYSIVIPPPNVTGSLHIGHALNNTLQDLLCRFMRMNGKEVLWMPGTDHAGIATQSVVERQLKAEGIDKHDLGREKFLERVWKWKEESGGTIIGQLKRLGCMCDWERERFTMDEGLSSAVREVFVRLYNEGLIYRGEYMINWSPAAQSALSDLEVEYPDEAEQGKIYGLVYPIMDSTEGGPTEIRVDTTRPETMLGDTAIAVHPDDDRYRDVVGKTVKLPIVGREIPIITDSFVDPEFGSGAVKLTPGHDPNDFEAGRRHDLEIVSVIGFDAKMTSAAGKYAGLDRFECRKQIIADLKDMGVLVEEKDHLMKVGRCYRTNDVVEPLVSTQWFVKTRGLADDAKAAVVDGKTRIVPEGWTKTYYQWLDNIRDWCISRQLWWGHQIPVWYCADCEHENVSLEDPTECSECGSSKLEQDPDVLDTWFSSALWPFSTMGWPEQTKTLEKFHPTSVLVTGFDILFFWVARMMMMGIKMTEQIPFHDVYLHAMVRDEHGQKMSKTKGNVIDPLELIDQYGADALRFTLVIMTVQGRDVNLATSRIEGYRNFVNKIWNAVRFAMLSAEDIPGSDSIEIKDKADLADDLAARWIRSRLSGAIKRSQTGYEEYQFSEIATASYRFFWDEFCAWYVEVSKLQLRQASDDAEKKRIFANITAVIDASLRMMHPVIPFVTEELWSSLPTINSAARERLINCEYPSDRDFGGALVVDEKAESEFELLKDVVTAVRTIRSEKNIPPGHELEISLESKEAADEIDTLLKHESLIQGLARVSSISRDMKPAQSATKVVAGIQVHVSLVGALDVEAEKARVSKLIAGLEKDHERTSRKLENETFLSKAPEDVVAKEKAKKKEFEEKLRVQRAALKELG